MTSTTATAAPTATAASSVTMAGLAEFANEFITDPLAALHAHQTAIAVLVLAAIAVPLVVMLVSRSLQDAPDLSLASTVEDEVPELEKPAADAPTSDVLWEIGVGKTSASVAEDGVLRIIAFTKDMRKPTAAHIIATIIKAVVKPTHADDDAPVHKPAVAVVLASRTCSDSVVAQVAAQLKKRIGLNLATAEELGPKLEEIRNKRKAEVIAKHKAEQIQMQGARPGIKNESVKLNPQPGRSCSVCQKDIEGKASQCSACKAVIYCSAACAKQNWPEHKRICPSLKIMMSHIDEWKLHDLPFTYYNSKTQLTNYNLVPFLTQQGYHNFGAFRRLCGCYKHVLFGEMAAELIASLQASPPTPEQKFEATCLPEEMFPLTKPFPPDFDLNKIDSWKSLYEAREWSLSNPAALVLDIPMTVWYLAHEFHLKHLPPWKAGDPQRNITIHLLGAEMEADSLGIFEVLLPLFRGTRVAIHMVGPNISPKIAPQHRSLAIRNDNSNSSLFATLNTDLYSAKYAQGEAFPVPSEMPPQFLDAFNIGAGKPDLVLILNGAVLAAETWRPTIMMLVQLKLKVLLTDSMEQMGHAFGEVIRQLGANVTVPVLPNPFRQPVFQFRRDVNIPAFSNGFYYGIGPLKN